MGFTLSHTKNHSSLTIRQNMSVEAVSEALGRRTMDRVSITVASPDVFVHGPKEVKNPETINYRTFKPEPEDCFAKRYSAGRVTNACGKYKRIKYKDVLRQMRRRSPCPGSKSRMGHIELAVPVSHIWFLKSMRAGWVCCSI